MQKTKICILGGGFGGLYTALYLAKTKQVLSEKWQITLVEPKDNFLFTPLLYEILTDELARWEIAPTYQKLLLGTKVNWIQDTVTELSLGAKIVTLGNNQPLTYDYLVLAVGRKIKYANIPGLAENALTFRSIDDAELLKNRCQILRQSQVNRPRLAIIGAGANGVELACKSYDFLRDIKPEIYLIDRSSKIVKNFNRGVNKAARKAIESREIKLFLDTNVKEISQDKIILQNSQAKKIYPVNLVLWTAGTETHHWIADLPAQKNKWGQLLTKPTLQLIDYPEVLALGDTAEIRNNKVTLVPTTAQAAYQQASTAAKNLSAIIRQKSLKKFFYLHLGDMLTLGKGEAIISSFGLNLTGKIAGFFRRLIYIQRLPTMKHRLQVFKNLLSN